MRHRLVRKAGIPALALIGVLAVAAPATAAPANETGGEQRLSPWAEASDANPAGKTPAINNDVGQPEGGTGSQLPLGLGLLGMGLLALVYGLGAEGRKRRAGASRSDAHAAKQPMARRPLAETRAPS